MWLDMESLENYSEREADIQTFFDVPKKPSRNRKTNNPAKLFTKAVGMVRMTNTRNVMI